MFNLEQAKLLWGGLPELPLRTLGWHVARLTLAAILLWVDLRLFLFYAFTLLLRLIHQVDHLRATVRVLSTGPEAKLIAIYRHLGINAEEIQRIAAEDNLFGIESADDRKALDEDWRLASGGRIRKW